MAWDTIVEDAKRLALKVNPRPDPLKTDRRFEGLTVRIGLLWVWQA